MLVRSSRQHAERINQGLEIRLLNSSINDGISIESRSASDGPLICLD